MRNQPSCHAVLHPWLLFGWQHVLSKLSLVVVDEAHRIYPEPTLRSHVEAHVHYTTRRILLSDPSQSSEREWL